MSDRPRDFVVNPDSVSDDDYSGLSTLAIPFVIKAETIAGSTEAIGNFFADLRELVERHPQVEIVPNGEAAVAVFGHQIQNEITLADRQKTAADQARRN